MQITIEIDDNKIDDFKNGFLAMHPVPDEDPPLTPKQWIERWIREKLRAEYRNGMKKRTLEALEIDEEIVK